MILAKSLKGACKSLSAPYFFCSVEPKPLKPMTEFTTYSNRRSGRVTKWLAIKNLQ